MLPIYQHITHLLAQPGMVGNHAPSVAQVAEVVPSLGLLPESQTTLTVVPSRGRDVVLCWKVKLPFLISILGHTAWSREC